MGLGAIQQAEEVAQVPPRRNGQHVVGVVDVQRLDEERLPRPEWVEVVDGAPFVFAGERDCTIEGAAYGSPRFLTDEKAALS